MECLFCGGSSAEQISSYVYEDKGHLIYVMNVPSNVCEDCGEKSFSPEVSERLYQICVSLLETLPPIQIRPHEKKPYRVEVPAINYAEAS